MASDDPVYSDDLDPFDGPDSDEPDTDLTTAAGSGSVIDPGLEAAQELEKHFSSSTQASIDAVVRRATDAYLSRLDPQRAPDAEIIEQRLLNLVNTVIDRDNRTKTSSNAEKQSRLRALWPWQIAQIMLTLHRIIRVAPSDKDTDREYDLLAMYQPEGPSAGTYTSSEDDLRTCARRYSTRLSLNDFKEVTAVLREDAPRVTQCRHRDLIAVNNGIFHYGTEDAELEIDGTIQTFQAKSLHPFDPRIVFLTKCHIDYVADAVCPMITHPQDGTVWDIESWIQDLSDHEGVPELLWEIIGAIIRPRVRWGKTAWFYSEVGNNGKGTLCALMRNLCGPRAHTSIPLSDFGKDFALEPLVRASAIIVDENDVGTYIDKAANLKAIVTNDVIQINRKHRMPIAHQFFGLMVQCLNEHPRVKDKSESFYRRQLFVPFDKSFTGHERRYIKNDYLMRTEVLEYVLWYCLHRAGADTPGSYYEFSEPKATLDELNEYKKSNDPVRAFWEDFREEYVWDLLPFTFLYDHYKAWMARHYPAGIVLADRTFIKDLLSAVRKDSMWGCPDRSRKIRPGQMMSAPEHLIHHYSLTAWMNPHYRGTNLDKICQPALQTSYRGLVRTASAYGVAAGLDQDDPDATGADPDDTDA